MDVTDSEEESEDNDFIPMGHMDSSNISGVRLSTDKGYHGFTPGFGFIPMGTQYPCAGNPATILPQDVGLTLAAQVPTRGYHFD